MSSRLDETARIGREERLSDRAAELLRCLGVPAFAGRAATWKHGRIMPLLGMIAFQFGALSSFAAITADVLVIAAPLVAGLAFCALPVAARVVRPRFPWHRWLLPFLVLVPIAAFCAIRDTVLPLRGTESVWFWPHYWCDAAITVVVLYTALIIVLPQAQAATGKRFAAHWWILLAIAAMTVASVSFFPVVWTMGSVGRATSLPQLVVICGLLVLALLMIQESADEGSARSYAVTVPAAVLVLVFGLVNARLVYVVDRPSLLMAVVTLSGLLILFALLSVGGVVARRFTGESGIRTLRRLLADPRMLSWVPVFLLAYPVAAGILFDQKVAAFGREYHGWQAVVALVGFNVSYLLFVWILVRFGVDRIIVWSCRRAVDMLRLVAGSASLLLIGVTFFAITAETWQVAHALTRQDLLLICVVQLALAAVLAVGWAWRRVRRQERFTSWAAVAEAMTLPECGCCDRRKEEHSTIVDDLKRAILEHPNAAQPPTKLNFGARTNTMFVVIAYQFLAFAVFIGTLFGMFYWLTRTAVSPAVAAEWIFGDGEGDRAFELVALPALDSPWLRVPLFLTLFSNLYFATNSLASRASRLEYFHPLDTAITARFAIRLGYLMALSGETRRQDQDEEAPAVTPVTGRPADLAGAGSALGSQPG